MEGINDDNFSWKSRNLIGKQLKIGETAPDFSLRASDLSIKSLSDFAGKKK